MPNDERNLETMPDGALGLIPLESCKELGLKVDQYLGRLARKETAPAPERPCVQGLSRDSLYHLNRSAAFRNRQKQRVSSKSLTAAMTCI